MIKKRKWLGSWLDASGTCHWTHVKQKPTRLVFLLFIPFPSLGKCSSVSTKPTPQSKNLHWKQSGANQRSKAICSLILWFLFTSALRQGMANDGSCATQLIDGDGEFNVAGLDNFIKNVNLASCGLSYAVVAIMGPQSSGAFRSFPLLVLNSWFTSVELPAVLLSLLSLDRFIVAWFISLCVLWSGVL